MNEFIAKHNQQIVIVVLLALILSLTLYFKNLPDSEDPELLQKMTCVLTDSASGLDFRLDGVAVRKDGKLQLQHIHTFTIREFATPSSLVNPVLMSEATYPVTGFTWRHDDLFLEFDTRGDILVTVNLSEVAGELFSNCDST